MKGGSGGLMYVGMPAWSAVRERGDDECCDCMNRFESSVSHGYRSKDSISFVEPICCWGPKQLAVGGSLQDCGNAVLGFPELPKVLH